MRDFISANEPPRKFSERLAEREQAPEADKDEAPLLVESLPPSPFANVDHALLKFRRSLR